MTARPLWLLLVVALALPGCLPGSWSTGHSGSSGAWSDPYGSTTSLDVQAGHQTGAMGDIHAYDADATRLEGTRDSYSTYVQLDSVGAGWWVMTGFTFNQDLDALVPGQTYYADSLYSPSGAYSTPSGAQAVDVNVRGCSGPSDGNYTFDDLASQATFHVETLPTGLRRVHYDCSFEHYGYGASDTQHASGYFDYQPSGTSSTSTSTIDVRGI